MMKVKNKANEPLVWREIAVAPAPEATPYEIIPLPAIEEAEVLVEASEDNSEAQTMPEETALPSPTPIPTEKPVPTKRPSIQYNGSTVYVTKTGKKFHREDCSSLSKSKIPISFEEACAKMYEPCGKCQP